MDDRNLQLEGIQWKLSAKKRRTYRLLARMDSGFVRPEAIEFGQLLIKIMQNYGSKMKCESEYYLEWEKMAYRF